MLADRIDETVGVEYRQILYRGLDILRVPILLPENIPTAIFCATLTAVLLGSKSIIITEFFACLNIAFGHNPDGAFGDQDFTIGVTGMVDIASFVLQRFSVNIIAV